jgi:phage terminase large subunit
MAEWVDTESYFKIKEQQGRIVVVQGGTSAGKTYDICAILADLSFDINNEIISITTDTFPNLRRGAMRDMKNFLIEHHWLNLFDENKSTSSFRNRATNTTIEFFSCDEMGALGARRDYLFVNEANRISYETFSQLEVRTRKRIWLDFNPVNRFWAHTELIENPYRKDEVDFVKLNYLDNKEALEPAIIKAIEARKGDGNNNWWRVYGLGEIGSLEGNIYEGWTPIEDIPEGFTLKRYGLDFGWNDPTACIAVYENDNGDICLDEMIYKSHLPTPDLVKILGTFEPALIVADSARPEVINDIRTSGLGIIGCDKSTKSPDGRINNVAYGISLVQERKVYYTAKSKNLESEFLTYAWRKKKTGEVLDVPEDGNDHTLDAVRYALLDMARKPVQYARPVIQ